MSDEGISEIAQQIIENHSTGLVPLNDPLREAQLSIQQSTLSTALIKAGSKKLPGGENNTISSLYQKVIKSSSSIPEFDWSKFMKQRHDAELAADISSHPNLVIAMSKAGNIFEQANSIFLNIDKKHFDNTLKNTRQLESFVELVLNTIRISTSPDGAIIATLNMADMAIAVTNCLKTCLESNSEHGGINKKFAAPIVEKGCIAWVQYEFLSNHSFESCCFSTKKHI